MTTIVSAPRKPQVSSAYKVAAIYLSILIFIFNPFYVFEGSTKFVIIGAVVVCSLVGSVFIPPIESRRMTLQVPLFLLLYGIAAIRMNDLPHDSTYWLARSQLQAMLCFLMFSTSWIVSRRVTSWYYLLAMSAFFSAICLMLLVNYEFLFNPRSYGKVGDFSFDSYQQVSTVFGWIAVVSAVSLPCWWKNNKLLFLFGISVATVAVFVVLVTPARGELIAMIVAIGVVFFPRLLFAATFFIVASIPAIIAILQNYDIPSMERFKIALDLGWNEPRIAIYLQSYELIFSEPFVFLYGGGGNYFQAHFKFAESLHPHNFLIEAWITGGFAFMLVAFSIFVLPVARAYLRQLTGRKVDPRLLATCTFLLVLAMKSTSFNSNWLLAIGFPLFLYLRNAISVRLSDKV